MPMVMSDRFECCEVIWKLDFARLYIFTKIFAIVLNIGPIFRKFYEILDVLVTTGMSEPYRNERPLFVGHYWLTGEPEPLGSNIACVDCNIAKSGPGSRLCAYRWDGEDSLCSSKFVWVGS